MNCSTSFEKTCLGMGTRRMTCSGTKTSVSGDDDPLKLDERRFHKGKEYDLATIFGRR